MKLWTLTFALDDYYGPDNEFIDVFAHPPSMDEIKASLKASKYGYYADQDLHKALEIGSTEDGDMDDLNFALFLKEVDRHL